MARNNSYKKIRNINNLQQQKRKLKTKLKIRNHLFNKHIRDFEDDFSGDYLYRQTLKTFKLNNPLFSFLPSLLKNSKNNKKIIPITGGIGVVVGIALYFLKNNKTTKEDI